MSWQQLIGIKQEAREIEKEERTKPPLECPNDGTPLQYHEGRGIWHCPYDGYTTRTRDI